MPTLQEIEAQLEQLQAKVSQQQAEKVQALKQSAIDRTVQVLSARMPATIARGLASLWQRENRLSVSDTGAVTITLKGNVQVSPDNPRDLYQWLALDDEVKELLPPPEPIAPRPRTIIPPPPEPKTYTPKHPPGTLSGSMERTQAALQGLQVVEPPRVQSQGYNRANGSLQNALANTADIFDRVTRGR